MMGQDNNQEAGPSCANIVTPEQLQRASQLYEQGLQHLRSNDLEKAVELLGEALQTRIAAHGELAEECGTCYHRYGAALFYRAQEESDLFGKPLRQAALSAEPQGAAGQSPAPAAEDEKENMDTKSKGKAPMRTEDVAAAQQDGAEEGDDGEEEDEDAAGEGNAEEEEDDGGDMQLAWEMLEVARGIYSKSGNARELADVHMLLGDLAMETERFDSAAVDYREAITLMKANLEADDRHIAEAHYKAALTLHFLEAPEEALTHARQAVDICNARIARLSVTVEPTAADAAAAAATSDASAPAQDTALPAQREIADLRDILGDLAAKVEELEAAVAEADSTRATLKAAFSNMTKSLMPPSGAAGGSSSGGGGGSSSGGASPSTGAPAAAAAAASGGAGGVINLGVVGRGSRRINLQPVSAAEGGTGAADKPKRSLEDMMGPAAAGAVGFGAPVAVPAGFGGSASLGNGAFSHAAPDADGAKRAKVEAVAEDSSAAPATAADKPALPAFLQSSRVAAVYGGAQQPPNEAGQEDNRDPW